MGKTTGYHPVSLHVIRGAAEFCGWKFGTITRLKANASLESAEYRVVIVRSPRGADDWPPKAFRRQLQHCFVDDIQVTQVELSTHRQPQAYLKVRLNSTPMDKYMESD
jgi:hypothetical protein